MCNLSKCLTQQQYLAWQQMARRVRTRIKNDYCEDCLPEFQSEMLKKNQCQHPEVTFRVDEDGFVSGYRSQVLEAA